MHRFAVLAARALLPFGLFAAAGHVPAARASDHLLISEFAVTPTDGEFVEIFNPTAEAVDLTNYYITDYVLSSNPLNNYWRLVDGQLVPDPAFPNDFLAKFPDGATIQPGETVVVALHDDGSFTSFWSQGSNIAVPDYELVQDGSIDGVLDMVDPGPAAIGAPYIQSAAGLSNAREVIVLFHWDGESDLVQDVDIVQWSDAGPVFNTVSPVKTGVSVDGPDADTAASTYLPDTAPQGQELAAPGAHNVGRTVTRISYQEGDETLAGGNGVTGHDETSENLSVTWRTNTEPSIGSPGDFGPPALLAANALSESELELEFSRALDPATATDASRYRVTQIESPGGRLVSVPLAVRSAALREGGTRVLLETDAQVATALYEVAASGILSADLTEVLTAGSRRFFRGSNPGPGVRLEVPLHPFVPHLDRQLEISYTAPQGERVLLRLFDTSGRELFVLADELAPAGGMRTLQWDGRDDLRQRVPAGVYYLQLEASGSGGATVAPLVVAVAGEEALR